jgi:hypothetical protein
VFLHIPVLIQITKCNIKEILKTIDKVLIYPSVYFKNSSYIISSNY